MTDSPRDSRMAFFYLLAALLLIAMLGLGAGSVVGESPTFDEGLYIARGWAYLRTGHLLPTGHPPLTNEIVGLGVLLEPGLPDPTTLNGWADDNPQWVSDDLLWRRGLDASRIVFLGRLPLLLLGLLFGALVWRWGRELYGPWSATLALAFFAFSPTVLAHAPLAATDLGVAAFYVGALYAWTRFLRRRTIRWLVIGGVLFGLAQASKFSALVLVPALGLMTLWAAYRRGPLTLRGGGRAAAIFDRLGTARGGWLWTALASLVGMGVIGLLAMWACYLFTLQPLAPGQYIPELQHFFDLSSQGHRAYLLGRFSQNGWWYYHPFTLLVKLTLPELLLLVLAVGLIAVNRIQPREWELIFPAGVYLAVSMAGSLNVGIRYLLPILPLMFLFSARIGPSRSGWLRYAVAGALVIWQIVMGIVSYPHYLAFFNLAAGGPQNGYRLLADSNLDWGQDLPGLAEYLQERGVESVYLSYFGQADPAYYGINAVRLPGWPPPYPAGPEFHPLTPPPGLYAISASNLVGVQLLDQDTFGYFRARQPVAQIGYSIFIYEVPLTSEQPTWAAQCAVPAPAESAETLRLRSGIDNLRHFYFDCTQNLPFPEGSGWILLPAGATALVDLGQPDYFARWPDGSTRYTLWRVDGAPSAPGGAVLSPQAALPIPVADQLELLGYEASAVEVHTGDSLTVTEWWRVRQLPQPPVSIFAHLLTPEGALIQSADGLGTRAEDWSGGMVFIQRHTFFISEDTPPADYVVAVGLYSLTTGERFAISRSADRVVDQIILLGVRVLPSP